MTTSPQQRRVDLEAHEAVALKNPCVILLEADLPFSFLVARATQNRDVEGSLLLESTTRLRGDSLHHFPKVEIYKTAEGFWVAQDCQSECLLYNPSEDPYRLVHLPREHYESLRMIERIENTEGLRCFFLYSFGKLPGFSSPDLTTLAHPKNYACALDGFDEARFI